MVAGAGSVDARPRPPLVQNSVLGVNDSNKILANADSFGTIYGCIKDDKNEPIVNASIALTRNDTIVGGAISDFDGKYQITNLNDGIYKITVSYPGLETQRMTDIQVVKGAESEVNIVLRSDGRRKVLNGDVKITVGKKKLINPIEQGKTEFNREQIRHLPIR
jgi:hypothetical protein